MDNYGNPITRVKREIAEVDLEIDKLTIKANRYGENGLKTARNYIYFGWVPVLKGKLVSKLQNYEKMEMLTDLEINELKMVKEELQAELKECSETPVPMNA